MQLLAGLAATMLRMLLELYGAPPVGGDIRRLSDCYAIFECSRPVTGLPLCSDIVILMVNSGCSAGCSFCAMGKLLECCAASFTADLLSRAGTAEASGYYSDAAGRIREHDRRNHRILLDTFLVRL